MRHDIVGGADFLIIQAIKAGHHHVPAIADYARVETLAARAALNRLRNSGKVRRYGTTRFARYILVKRRSKNACALALLLVVGTLFAPSVRPSVRPSFLLRAGGLKWRRRENFRALAIKASAFTRPLVNL